MARHYLAAAQAALGDIGGAAPVVVPAGESSKSFPVFEKVCEALIDAHRDLDAAASHALNARLVLLLANHVGRLDVLRQALAAARASAHDRTGDDR